jgi:hypothetical protein
MEFCSPSATKRKYCYSKESLAKIIKIWNFLNPTDKVIVTTTDTVNDVINKINEKFKKDLHKDNVYWAWIDILKQKAKDKSKTEVINDLIEIEKKELRPAQPREWVNNPVEWLSNYDISKVMRQYEAIPENKYRFLGVFSIDFGVKRKVVDIKTLLKSGVKYLGFITNLSRSHEPGTHWTSSFFVLDPSLPSFGGYYYDSTTGKIPNDLQIVFMSIKNQVESIFKKPFPIAMNYIRHQKSNTECGVFSMAFQVLWLNLLRINSNTASFAQVIKQSQYTDAKMKKLRFGYFRPNIIHLKRSINSKNNGSK